MAMDCFCIGSDIIDMINPATGRSSVYGETLEEMRLRRPGVEIGDSDVCMSAQIEQARTPPAEITAEQFDHGLNVLPPRRWVRRGEVQTFHISERIIDNVVAIYCKIADRCWRMQDFATLTHDEIVTACRAL
jgi:hypothetical protein